MVNDIITETLRLDDGKLHVTEKILSAMIELR
jgi:hypothetical protein